MSEPEFEFAPLFRPKTLRLAALRALCCGLLGGAVLIGYYAESDAATIGFAFAAQFFPLALVSGALSFVVVRALERPGVNPLNATLFAVGLASALLLCEPVSWNYATAVLGSRATPGKGYATALQETVDFYTSDQGAPFLFGLILDGARWGCLAFVRIVRLGRVKQVVAVTAFATCITWLPNPFATLTTPFEPGVLIMTVFYAASLPLSWIAADALNERLTRTP